MTVIRSRSSIPTWLRWVLSLTAAGCVVGALIVVVSRNPLGSQGSSAASRRGAAEANREGRIVTAQDEAPHQRHATAGVSLPLALSDAIAGDMRHRVATGDIAGPVQHVACHQTSSSHRPHLVFARTARVGGFPYPVAGVIDTATRRLTWCKNDSATVDPAIQLPLSRSCTH